MPMHSMYVHSLNLEKKLLLFSTLFSFVLQVLVESWTTVNETGLKPPQQVLPDDPKSKEGTWRRRHAWTISQCRAVAPSPAGPAMAGPVFAAGTKILNIEDMHLKHTFKLGGGVLA